MMFGRDVIKLKCKEKIFLYTVRFDNTLNIGTIIFRSQYVLHLTLFTFPLRTYVLHGAESILRSSPVFGASQEILRIFMEPEVSLTYSQVLVTRHYPEPTPSSPHDFLKHSEHPS
jgi:hypothetical protein